MRFRGNVISAAIKPIASPHVFCETLQGMGSRRNARMGLCFCPFSALESLFQVYSPSMQAVDKVAK